MDAEALWRRLLTEAMGYRPFDPSSDTPQDVGLGGPSTEYLQTNDAPDFGFWNIPSIWWRDGEPTLMNDEAAGLLAYLHEDLTGDRFPRYITPGQGAFHAMSRSALGGGQAGPLAKKRGW